MMMTHNHTNRYTHIYKETGYSLKRQATLYVYSGYIHICVDLYQYSEVTVSLNNNHCH